MQFDTAKFERCRALGAQRLEKIDEPREQRIEPAELIGIRQDECDRLVYDRLGDTCVGAGQPASEQLLRARAPARPQG